MPFSPGGARARLSVRLTTLGDAAARLDRAALPRVLDPLTRMDRRVLARLLPVVLLLARAVRGTAGRVAEAVADWVLPPSATVQAPQPVRRTRRWAAAGAREVAVCAGLVLLAGTAALGVQPRPVSTAALAGSAVESRDRPGSWTVPGVHPSRARLEPRPAPDLRTPSGASAGPTPPVVEAVAEAAPATPAAPPAPDRWLPSGTGMWLHDWSASEGGAADAVVARAQAAGLTHLYVQTGSSKKGWIGEEVLSELLPATAGSGVRVIAWDFPKLVDPEGDARRLVQAARWQAPGVPRVAAVAPDVETAAEGAHLSAEAVVRYYATLRAELPADVAVLATVPWPSEKRIGRYPYAETAAASDALVPMAYWYNRSPVDVTAASMSWLAQFGLPVMPVGQGYDARLDAPYLAPDPDPAASVRAFVGTARAGGARSVSLWSWQTMSPPTWQALVEAGPLAWPPVA